MVLFGPNEGGINHFDTYRLLSLRFSAAPPSDILRFIGNPRGAMRSGVNAINPLCTAVGPGLIKLARIVRAPSSLEKVRASPSMADLVAL